MGDRCTGRQAGLIEDVPGWTDANVSPVSASKNSSSLFILERLDTRGETMQTSCCHRRPVPAVQPPSRHRRQTNTHTVKKIY